MWIVKFKSYGMTCKRFHLNDGDLAQALIWAGLSLGFDVMAQTPGECLLHFPAYEV